MSHISFALLSDRRVTATLLTAASTFFLLVAEGAPAAATITARLNGVQGKAAPQTARQPPRVLDAESVQQGLQRRLEQSQAARQRSLNARRLERPKAPEAPLPRHFDPDRWSGR